MADEVRRRFGVQDIYINYVGPVIGNHSGPGTLALFFLGSRPVRTDGKRPFRGALFPGDQI